MAEKTENGTLADRFAWYAALEKPLQQFPEDWLAAQVDAYRSLHNALEGLAHGTKDGYQLRSVRLCEARNPPGWAMCVLQAERRSKRYVAFRVAELAPEALLRMWQDLQGGSVAWREESPYEGNGRRSNGEAATGLPDPL